MKVTVLVCTWNRAHLLDRALAEMQRLQVPADVEWDLLVINNNSTDDTEEVLDRHSQVLPLRRLFEPKPGKSYALNLAVSQATGELIVFTDDDVLVSPEWLAAYVSAAQQFPDAAFFAGTIDPWFEVEPPDWIKLHVVQRGPYSVLQHGNSVRPLAAGEAGPFGANMAIRASALREFAFNPSLGRFENEVLPAEDGELFLRLKNAGYWGVWVGPATVQHFVPAERLTRRYIWNWYRSYGRTQVIRHEMEGCKYVFGVPRWALRKYITARLVSLLLFPTRGRRWVRAYKDAAGALGVLQQARAWSPSLSPRHASVSNSEVGPCTPGEE